MKNKIAILLPYKEKYNVNKAGAASIWVKDYLLTSKLKKMTTVYGNLLNKDKPLTKNFFNIDLTHKIVRKNISYTEKLFQEYNKKKFEIIEIHNRPESLYYLLNKNVKSKIIFIFHNNPKEMRGSRTVKERIFLAEKTDQIYFVSKWVKDKFFEGLPYNHRNNCEILYPAIKPLTKFPLKKKINYFYWKIKFIKRL